MDQSTQLAGLLILISVCFVIILSVFVLHIAIKRKNKLLYAFCLFMLFLNTPWIPSAFGYLYWLITGKIFAYQIYILLGTMGIPIAFLTWFYIYTSLLHPHWKKYVLISIGIYSIIFYVYVFYFLFFAPGAPIDYLIGIKKTELDIEYRVFVLIYIASLLIIGAPTFLHFAIASIRTKDDPKIQWRGRFILISLILFMIGAPIDALFTPDPIFLVGIRIILLLTALFFYMGFVMPDWVKKLLKLEMEEHPTPTS
ncbi:MAG: hypothetical protein EU529_06700 [Promethearchaeota archaeon]|nr:MAG: hypothetical protein EU529_06700 [Candidatus Lokiarchaeota archaeon]